MGVIYLVWLPYGIEHFKVFINSYVKYDADLPHQLIIVFNGLSAVYPNQPEEYMALMESRGVTAGKCLYYQQGQDLEIYREAAVAVNTDLILFLNSYSEIRAAGWLKYYAENFTDNVGIIGASGSLQSYYSSVFQKHAIAWERGKSFLANFRKYKLFIKAFVYWRLLFKPFPNPHVRTNAFMVRRTEFLTMKNRPPDTKFKAYQFENGRKSLTAFYLAKGLKVLVLDKYGKTFEPAEWKDSSTFWINNQENLLVADNQTKIYTIANAAEKKEMTRLAWGTV